MCKLAMDGYAILDDGDNMDDKSAKMANQSLFVLQCASERKVKGVSKSFSPGVRKRIHLIFLI